MMTDVENQISGYSKAFLIHLLVHRKISSLYILKTVGVGFIFANAVWPILLVAKLSYRLEIRNGRLNYYLNVSKVP